MMPNLLKEKAQKRVHLKKKMVEESLTYLSISVILLFINFKTGAYLWSLWPIGLYGIAVFFSNLDTIKELLFEKWEDELIEKEYPSIEDRQDIVNDKDDYLDLHSQLRNSVTPQPHFRWDERDFV